MERGAQAKDSCANNDDWRRKIDRGMRHSRALNRTDEVAAEPGGRTFLVDVVL